MIGKWLPEPEIHGHGLVIGPDGRVKVEDLEALPPDLRRAVDEFNARTNGNGSDPGN